MYLWQFGQKNWPLDKKMSAYKAFSYNYMTLMTLKIR